ncbi:hypothetical protein Tco_1171870, partial [Tanacetum coccineum]
FEGDMIVGIKSLLMLLVLLLFFIDVNAALSKLVLLENFNENYSKCLRLLKVNTAEGVNAASEEVSTAELLWCHVMVLVAKNWSGSLDEANYATQGGLILKSSDYILSELSHEFKFSKSVWFYRISGKKNLNSYKKNESVYLEKINGLKWDIQLIECQIVDNCKKGLGYEKYNALLPPYTRNFMPSTPDLSFTGLDEFVNKPVVENRKSDEEVSEIVRKNNDALIIEEWVLDSEEENVSQPKIVKKIVKPSLAKIEFVKPKQQEKTDRKTVKQAEKHRQNTHSPRGNQRN